VKHYIRSRARDTRGDGPPAGQAPPWARLRARNRVPNFSRDAGVIWPLPRAGQPAGRPAGRRTALGGALLSILNNNVGIGSCGMQARYAPRSILFKAGLKLGRPDIEPDILSALSAQDSGRTPRRQEVTRDGSCRRARTMRVPFLYSSA
jgi:hypothetical protein